MCLITALLLCVADPSWSFSLQALYSAFGSFSLLASPLHG